MGFYYILLCLLSTLSLKYVSGSRFKDLAYCSDFKCAVRLVGNGECDAACLTDECRYDDLECCDSAVCPEGLRGNGVCDASCDSVACGFDAGDCPIDEDEDRVFHAMNFFLISLVLGIVILVVCVIAVYRSCCRPSDGELDQDGEEENNAGKLEALSPMTVSPRKLTGKKSLTDFKNEISSGNLTDSFSRSLSYSPGPTAVKIAVGGPHSPSL